MAFAEAKKVYQWNITGELIAVYPSVNRAAESVGASCGNISQACNGKTYGVGGYRWTFTETPWAYDEPPKRGLGGFHAPIAVKVTEERPPHRTMKFKSIRQACRSLPNLTGGAEISNANVFNALSKNPYRARCGGYIWAKDD